MGWRRRRVLAVAAALAAACEIASGGASSSATADEVYGGKTQLDRIQSTQCATCAMLTFQLWTVLSDEKERLEPQRQAKLKLDTKMIKPQTKRWLKQGYDAALRDAIENALDGLCSDTIFQSALLGKAACDAFLEQHADALADAVLGDRHAQLCAAIVPGCSGEHADRTLRELRGAEAPASSAVVKSEHVPTKETQWATDERLVRRLVGLTYSEYVHSTTSFASSHAFIMAYKGGGTKKRTRAHAALIAAFHSLASSLHQNGKPLVPLSFAQIDLRKNELPRHVAYPSGALHFQLFLLGADAKTPKLFTVDGAGRGAGGSGDDAAVRRLVDVLCAELPEDHAATLRHALSRGEARAGRLRDGGGGDGTGGRSARRRGTRPSEAQPEREVLETQECEMCGLIATDLFEAHRVTAIKHGMSKSDRSKRDKRLEGVQNPQTRRWLQREHGALLAAELEERLEDVCLSRRLESLACSVKTFVTLDGVFAEHSLLRRGRSGKMWDGNSFDSETCRVRVEERCPAAVEQYADGIIRGILDGNNADVCTRLVARCTQPVAQTFNSSYLSDSAARKREEETAAQARRASPQGILHDAIDDLAELGDLDDLLKEEL